MANRLLEQVLLFEVNWYTLSVYNYFTHSLIDVITQLNACLCFLIMNDDGSVVVE